MENLIRKFEKTEEFTSKDSQQIIGERKLSLSVLLLKKFEDISILVHALSLSDSLLLPVSLPYEYSIFDQQSTESLFIGWSHHIIQLTLSQEPYSTELLDLFVNPAFYSERIKQKAYQHKSHIELTYIGQEQDPFLQYAALSRVVIALVNLGAVVAINEDTGSSLPTDQFIHKKRANEGRLSSVMSIPILSLVCGIIRSCIDGHHILLRTQSSSHLKSPDFATIISDSAQSTYWYTIFLKLLRHMHYTKLNIDDGAQAKIDEKINLRFYSYQGKLPAPMGFKQNRNVIFWAELV